MPPSIPLPTDNIYKFVCLFGLALIVTAVFSFVSTYTSLTAQTMRHAENIIHLEAKSNRAASDDELLKLYKAASEEGNEAGALAYKYLAKLLLAGIFISITGAVLWLFRIQMRDDGLVKLQIKKLELEIVLLEGQAQARKSNE